MGDNTKIQWTDATANLVAGCTQVSAGCRNCFAERLAGTRVRNLPLYSDTTRPGPAGRPEWTGVVKFGASHIEKMLGWERPRRIFLTTVSDPFHASLTNEDIAALFGFMAARPAHTFQVLTKRPERFGEWFAWVEKRGEDGKRLFPDDSREWRIRQMLRVAAHSKLSALKVDAKLARKGDKNPEDPCGPWPLPNVELIVSVEDQATADLRIPLLLAAPAAVRGVSLEPMLAPVFLHEDWLRGAFVECTTETQDPETDPCVGCRGFSDPGGDHCGAVRGPRLSWLIVGGESGPGARPFDLTWAKAIVERCQEHRVPVFFKQAGKNPMLDGAPLTLKSGKGDDLDELPAYLRVRRMPGHIFESYGHPRP